MADEESAIAPALRLVSFISEEQLDQVKKTRGEKVEDGTAERGRPLYEILKENKDRKDAEFNERFKHRPPKALDEDEMEFLDKLETSKREYERQLASEEAEELRSFQEAVAAQSSFVQEIKESSTLPKTEEIKPAMKRSHPAQPRNFIISVKPHAKIARKDDSADKSSHALRPSNGHGHVDKKSPDDSKGALGALVSYSDESEDDD